MLENLMWLIAGVALGFIFEEIRYAPEDPEKDFEKCFDAFRTNERLLKYWKEIAG